MSSGLSQFLLDLINGVIGAFVGFFLAVLLQKQTEKKDAKKKILLVLTSITDELKEISEDLKHFLEKGVIVSGEIYVPNWEAVFESGIIVELIDHDMKIYSLVIETYNYIRRINDERNRAPRDMIMEYMNTVIKNTDIVSEYSEQFRRK